MKKIISLLLVVAMVLGFASSCKKDKVDIAMVIADKGTFDDGSFHSSIWNGIDNYSKDNELSSTYYEAENTNYDSFILAIEQAIDDGAELIIAPGAQLSHAIYDAQDKYPETTFIYVDYQPMNQDGDVKISKNTYALMYAEEQAGFLAGYAAIMDGYKKLGFYGGKQIPPVIRFGHGYLQGAEYAAKQLGYDANTIELRYLYGGDFISAPKHQARARTWYKNQGTEVIFACGGGIWESIVAAAEGNNGRVIGVDTDQAKDAPGIIITSAIKQLSSSVYDAIKSYYDDKFPGGTSANIGADQNGVGLAMKNAIFNKFDQNKYNEIYEKIAQNKEDITTNILKDDVKLENIPIECVTLIVESV